MDNLVGEPPKMWGEIVEECPVFYREFSAEARRIRGALEPRHPSDRPG